MGTIRFAASRRALTAAAPLALGMALAGCFNGGGDGGGDVSVIPTPTPTPTSTASPSGRDVSKCLSQVIPGTDGATPASLVIPDTIKLDLSKPSGFPNGRGLEDQSPDILLAVLFLDVNAPGQSPATFANLPLNPPANDRPFLATFPFVAPPQGTPPLAPGTGTTFNFRSDPDSAYVRVDREGQPAISTAVIGASLKNAYNDANPVNDAAALFAPEIVKQLSALHDGLADDLTALGLKVCSS